jgi:hypothetical protein
LITSSQPSQPSLTVTAAGRNVTVTWPAGIPYHLQSATSLNSPVAWSNYAQSPVTNGTQVSVTVSNSTGRQFFRLQSP